MGDLVGHVSPGIGILVIGLWHLLNHISLHTLHPKAFIFHSWFPTPFLRHFELLFIMASFSYAIAKTLFISPSRHLPFDPDGSIPTRRILNFEHSSIYISFAVYAFFAILLDRARPRAHRPLTALLAALSFLQQLLIFHFHSTGHSGLEGHYHLLLELIVFNSLITTLLGIAHPKSFLLSFVRSVCIIFQGVWLVVIGIALWTPDLVPKDCFLSLEKGRKVVRCHDDEALHRAKSLATLLFSWCMVGIFAFAVSVYLVFAKICGKKGVDYEFLTKYDEYEGDDVEAHESNQKGGM